MKTLTAIVLFTTAVLYSSCSFNRNSNSSQINNKSKNNEIVTNYSFNAINYAKNINLLKDNRFVITENINRVNGDTTIKKHYGTFQKTSNVITLEPKETEMTLLVKRFENVKESNIYSYEQNDSKINTRYYIVKWNDKEYLLSDQFNSISNHDEKNDFQRFAYFFNSGIEPSEGGYYFKRTYKPTDSVKTSFNIEQIPQQWRTYFLTKPISANIIDTEKELKNSKFQQYAFWRIKLNKGAKDGIKKGVSFSTKFEDFHIRVDSILPDVCFGSFRINDFDDEFIEIGTEMRTQWASKAF
ncbi:hypothetical protein SAMN04489761_1928 [Tenacibaculum sp. MAR_2009_124]|uniref:hypothetical protein n=1 Tax=Tenacibaculum sp. MAR_2009_124 TaxID=1250059 RepID=UPI0008974029|nr:hypothetical protein [Tenacibaculum sp. MAR_2009_124]SEB84261.1 hypothetical protein SAMN04489761_1928 [Tenacibaculum sp. MAR_2009_124]